MPTYEYVCPDCGSFAALRPLAEFRQPQPCPSCARPAPRVTLNVPALGGMLTRGGSDEGSKSLQSCFHRGGCSCC